MALDFDTLRDTNVRRSEAAFGVKLLDWSPPDWACALAGEVGELANLLKKKYLRGEDVDVRAIADELADVQTYLDLLAARLGIDLGAATVRKFNEVSERRRCSIRLNPQSWTWTEGYDKAVRDMMTAMRVAGVPDVPEPKDNVAPAELVHHFIAPLLATEKEIEEALDDAGVGDGDDLADRVELLVNAHQGYRSVYDNITNALDECDVFPDAIAEYRVPELVKRYKAAKATVDEVDRIFRSAGLTKGTLESRAHEAVGRSTMDHAEACINDLAAVVGAPVGSLPRDVVDKAADVIRHLRSERVQSDTGGEALFVLRSEAQGPISGAEIFALRGLIDAAIRESGFRISQWGPSGPAKKAMARDVAREALEQALSEVE